MSLTWEALANLCRLVAGMLSWFGVWGIGCGHLGGWDMGDNRNGGNQVGDVGGCGLWRRDGAYLCSLLQMPVDLGRPGSRAHAGEAKEEQWSKERGLDSASNQYCIRAPEGTRGKSVGVKAAWFLYTLPGHRTASGPFYLSSHLCYSTFAVGGGTSCNFARVDGDSGAEGMKGRDLHVQPVWGRFGAWRAPVPMPSQRRNQPSTSNLFIKVTTPTPRDISPTPMQTAAAS